MPYTAAPATGEDRGDGGRVTPGDGLAFAGLRAQAALVADGEVSSRELVDAALARIEASQPDLNAFRCVRAEAAHAEADAGRSAARAGGAPAAARRPDRDQGRHGPRGRVDQLRLRRRVRSAPGRRRGCAQAARRRRGDRRQDEHARARPVAVHRGARVRRNAQPVVARAQPRRLLRRLGGRRCRRPRRRPRPAPTAPARCGSRRPGRTSSASSRSAGASRRGRMPSAFNGLTCVGPLARTVDDAALLLDVLSGNRVEDAHRPPPPPEPFAEAAAREPGRLRIALSTKVPWSLAPAALDPAVRAQVERLGACARGARPPRRGGRPALRPRRTQLPSTIDGRGTRVGRAARDGSRAARPAHPRHDPDRTGAAPAAAARARDRARRCAPTSGGSSAASTSC